jgi:hypothetical protein
MDKDKLRGIIVEGSEEIGCDKCMAVEKLIEFVLAKISDEVVIAEGEVGYYKIKGIDRSEYTTLKIGNATFNGVVREIIEQKYQGKSIRLKLEVLE